MSERDEHKKGVGHGGMGIKGEKNPPTHTIARRIKLTFIASSQANAAYASTETLIRNIFKKVAVVSAVIGKSNIVTAAFRF